MSENLEPASSDDVIAAGQVPAFMANKVLCSSLVSGQGVLEGVRLTFGESLADPHVSLRGAVFLPNSTAQALRDILLGVYPLPAKETLQ